MATLHGIDSLDGRQPIEDLQNVRELRANLWCDIQKLTIIACITATFSP